MNPRKDESSVHSKICRCDLCMRSYLTQQEEHEQLKGLQATMVDRRNPKTRELLLETVAARSVLRAGSVINMLQATGLSKDSLPSSYDILPTEPEELHLHALWKNKDEEKAKSGSDANLFGNSGVLVVSGEKSVNIPKMNALSVPKSFLDKYGVHLIPLDQSFLLEKELHPSLKNLYLIDYKFDKNYVDDYVMKMEGGGGIFVERHPFPQIFTPTSPKSSGPLIIGKDNGNDEYSFIALEIPFGYTIKIDPMVIHGDSCFVGPYAIALTITDLADTVLFRKDNAERDIQVIKECPVESAEPPLHAEDRLQREFNRQMLLDKYKYSRRFFEALPSSALADVHHVSDVAQEVHDRRMGLVPYNKQA